MSSMFNSTTTIANVAKAANSVSNTLTTAVNSALGKVNSAVNSAANSTVSAVNSAANSTVSAVNSAANAAKNAAKNAIPSANSLMSFNNSGKNSGNNSSKNSGFNNFMNVFNNKGANSGANNFKNAAANTASASQSSSLGTLFGVGLFLVGVFLVAMFVFQDEFNVAWNYLVTSFRKLFKMDAPITTPENKEDKEERDVTGAPPSSVETAATADSKSASLLSKILPMGSKEVFNVSVNDYTYYDAEPLCLALGAELANYEQVKEAWNKGADWCNYGWTKGQLAIYPTQKETWNKLQHGPPDQKGACGRPGVNGGFFDNPEMRFGVNCYGVKPEQSANDERLLMENGTIPRTASTLKMDKQIQDIKNNLDTIGILPFSSSKWSA